MSYKKRGRRLSKLQMSNNAHFDLQLKHRDSTHKDADLFYRYHKSVGTAQFKQGRIFSKEERRAIFNKIKSRLGSFY